MREIEGGRGRAKAGEGGVAARHVAPALWSRIAYVLRRIVGAPDYSAYLEHCRTAGHAVLLSEREYVSEFFERKGKTVRCC